MTESLIGPLSYPAINTTLWGQGSYISVARGGAFVLVADVVNAALQTNYSALRLPGAAGGYQVTSGKTLYITKIRAHAQQNNLEWQILSGTADAGDSQAAAPAGVLAEDSRADGVEAVNEILTARVVYEWDALLAIAADRFPCIRSLSAATEMRVEVWCHEE